MAAFGATSPTTHDVEPTANGFTINIASGTDNVEYQFVTPAIGSLYSIGSILISDSIGGASPQGQITLPSNIDWLGGSKSLQAITYQQSSPYTVVMTFGSPAGTTRLTITPLVDGKFAGLKLSADSPAIQDIYLGQLPSSLTSQPISVPYYSQPVNYLSGFNLFENSFFNPFDSHATVISAKNGQETYYGPNESGIHNTLKDIWEVSVSSVIDDVLPYPEHPASPYLSKLAGRMTLDIRNEAAFPLIASQLSNLADYGVDNCNVIIGTWQYQGYDDELPKQYPANAGLGGDTGILDISNAAKSASCLFALHQNYTDYYPDFPGFTASAIMRNLDGSQMLAWLNPVTHIQSFAVKPSLFVPDASTQSPLIHQQYATDSSFIDVNSSVTPWWRTDEDPAASGTGAFAPYRDASISLWAYERNIENGPVFGEGKYHWFWSGLLDGVEAQFGAESTPITNGLTAPLFVDFDLTRVHPLQVNYGMGYYDRWSQSPINTLGLDAYRMQEVIFGHAPYLADGFWASAYHALLEQSLVSPTAARYGTQTPTAISYLVNGSWTDASTAAKAGAFTVAQVTYPNGDSIVANSSASNIIWKSIQIPQYGWAASGTGYVAYTALVGNQVVDYSQTTSSMYADARNQADMISEGTVATPSVISFKQTAPRTLQMQLGWDINSQNPSVNYQEFVHLVSSQTAAGSNAFAGVFGGTLSAPSESWYTGERVTDSIDTYVLPPNIADGIYQIRVGLYSGAQRAVLYGNNDGTLRYTVGTLTVSSNGASLAFSATPIARSTPDPRLNSSGSVVDFGTVRTDGMVMLQQQAQGGGNTLLIRSYPRSRDVTIQLSTSVVVMPVSLTCNDGTSLIPSMVDQTYWQVDLRGKKYCSWSGTLPAVQKALR